MNAIQISNVTIQQTSSSLYNLNDLHKASGGAEKHRPTFWLRQQQIQEVIAELQAEGQEAVKVVNGGKNRGTFVCKELVYAYATWISAKFFLLVIRTFDAVASGKLKAITDKTTPTERTGLRNAVNLLVSKKGLNYSEAYNLVHQRFNVESIEDLSHSQLNEAVEYVHRVILEGEVLDKPKTLTCPDPALLHNTLAAAVEYFRDYGKLLQVLDKLPLTDSRMAFNTFNHVQEVCENIMKIATDWGLKNELGEPIFEPRRINFYNGAAVAW